MNKLLYALYLLVLCVSSAFAQSGEIQGRVVNETGEGIPFANVAIYKDGVLETGAQTDFDGKYTISALQPGTYDVEASYLGLKQKVTGITVSQGIVFLKDLVLSENRLLEEVVIVYQAPLVDKGNTSTGGVVTKEDIQKIATRNVTSIAATTEGVYQGDEGDGLNIKGSRGDATEYVIDGVRVSGSLKLPQDAIEQLEVITGGVDPKYGDATGGFITITTRGPAKDYNGSVELASSQFIDPYGYNLASLFLTGPIITKHKGTDSAQAKFGFYIAGEFEYELDRDPSAIGMYQVNDALMTDLINEPLRPSVSGLGFNKNSEFIHMDDLEHVDAKENTDSRGLAISTKFDYKFSQNTNIQLGLSWRNFYAHTYSRNFALFNAENNPLDQQDTYRGYLRFTQRFPDKMMAEGTDQSIIGNAYYSIQLDYTKFYGTREDEDLGMNPFAYGYIGQYNTYREPIYFYGTDEVTQLSGWYLAGYLDTLVEFTPGESNPALATYTSQYYEGSSIPPSSLFDIQLGGGLLNGETASLFLSTYSMWWNYGVPWFGYSTTNDDQYSVNFSAALDLKNPRSTKVAKHSIEFGFEFQQRIERFYAINPIGLWTIARQLTNRHILTLDTDHPILIIDGEEYSYEEYLSTPGLEFGEFDTIYYDRLFLADDQSYFDQQLRAKLNDLGYDIGALDYINIDNLPLDVFELNLFSADELLNQGSSLVGYQGYDYLGNVLTKTPSFNDFFTEKDGDVYSRPIDAFRPVYTAGYIQDRFNFNDIVFRVGVRVDRYDANRKVLKDKYSLYDVYSTGEVDGALNPNGQHPGNIGEDYVVYVDDFNSPSPNIVGYRDEDTWFNADGEEVSDPNVIANNSATGTITPYVIDPEANIKDETFDPNSSFEDYTPQITVMPRIAFSFPISKQKDREALFFAHYDILTQRPPTGTGATPADYYFFLETAGAVFENPDLKPEKTIDYQVGFQQQLTESTVIQISAFYKELRDMIQVINVPYAYPLSYTTFGNIDFGTVKGLTLSYDIARRTKNIKLSTSYTLQFADGTGSSATSQIGLLGAGQPNLRTIIPLTFDSRHAIKLVMDYRFVDPEGGQPKWLNDVGLNVTFNSRSGEPFTRQANATPTAQFGVQTRSNLDGDINGSRLPWHYRTDIKLDKSFLFNFGKADRPVNMNVYLWVQNLFDNENVIAVYPYTGNALDDGYLTSAEGSEYTLDQIDPQSFYDLYTIKMMNPDNYSIPRRIRIGLAFDF